MNEHEKKLDDFIDSYWNYFLELENEFASTQKYVAFDMSNANTYSIEFLKLYQAVCSEIDVLGKEILLHFEPNFKIKGTTGIMHWGYGITQYMRKSLSADVFFNEKIRVKPWAKFACVKFQNVKNATCYKLDDKCETPTWWSDYNKVKHSRTSCTEDGSVNYQRANFGNLVNAFAALYILEMFYADILMEKSKPYYASMNSKLFSMRFDDEEKDIENEADMAGVM